MYVCVLSYFISYRGTRDIFWQCFKTLLKHKDKKVLQFAKLQVVSQFELEKAQSHCNEKTLAGKVNIKRCKYFFFFRKLHNVSPGSLPGENKLNAAFIHVQSFLTSHAKRKSSINF